MKVREIIKKVNHGTQKLPIYLQHGAYGESREVLSFDYADYYYEEANMTVMSISLKPDRVVIHYWEPSK